LQSGLVREFDRFLSQGSLGPHQGDFSVSVIGVKDFIDKQQDLAGQGFRSL
jgi:hypothetical protein